ncbi:hypothetical protein [Absidia glauca]|uniref:Uncharacterized protein n=1 Tax=Absidia glauca TaxID=4829 RepID=A0A163M777_ABSGL|nr:hypothetical protein [Absidia glauca]
MPTPRPRATAGASLVLEDESALMVASPSLSVFICCFEVPSRTNPTITNLVAYFKAFWFVSHYSVVIRTMVLVKTMTLAMVMTVTSAMVVAVKVAMVLTMTLAMVLAMTLVMVLAMTFDNGAGNDIGNGAGNDIDNGAGNDMGSGRCWW